MKIRDKNFHKFIKKQYYKAINKNNILSFF